MKPRPGGQGSALRERDLLEAYAAHSGELYGFALRSLGEAELAEEAVEQTFLRAWRERTRFDPDIGSLRAWLFAILREVVIDLGRARPRQGLDKTLDAWQVEEALRRLDEQHRHVLIEAFYRGRPYAEIAIELDVPEGVVKSRAYDGLRALKTALDEAAIDR
jgi:RNA polymerase sigma-70 factor (ECF subfamily)